MNNPMFWLGLASLTLTIVALLCGAGAFLWRVASQSAASSATLNNSVKGLTRAVDGLLEFQQETHEFRRETHGRLKLLEDEAAERRREKGTGT